jgi:hypothetical protein
MDLLAPASSLAQTKNVPLVCSICPTTPTFSDLSHLLTHISSKAHLSTYYKLKIRSGSDGNARQSVEHYDIWYAENDIESSMSDRMKNKDERKKIKTGTYLLVSGCVIIADQVSFRASPQCQGHQKGASFANAHSLIGITRRQSIGLPSPVRCIRTHVYLGGSPVPVSQTGLTHRRRRRTNSQ